MWKSRCEMAVVIWKNLTNCVRLWIDMWKYRYEMILVMLGKINSRKLSALPGPANIAIGLFMIGNIYHLISFAIVSGELMCTVWRLVMMSARDYPKWWSLCFGMNCVHVAGNGTPDTSRGDSDKWQVGITPVPWTTHVYVNFCAFCRIWTILADK